MNPELRMADVQQSIKVGLVGTGSTGISLESTTINSNEHVIVVWLNEENNKLEWYLGVVYDTVTVNPLDIVSVSYSTVHINRHL